jgi:hypothetical protein
MVARRVVGIVFTPSWLRVAQAEMSRDRVYAVRLDAVPLPVGCINENSGALEDSEMLRDVIHSIPGTVLHHREDGEIFVVIPQLLCYRTSFVAPAGFAQASIKEILAAHPIELPGDRSSLVVDASAHAVSIAGARAVMVMAARRSSVEAYARLFKDREWCLGGMTTGEIARYNRWRLQCRSLSSDVALVCSADIDSQELSLWDRGVLIASDTRCWYQRERRSFDGNVDTEKPLGATTDRIAKAVANMIERANAVARPITQILFGGSLTNLRQLHERVHRLTGIQYEVSQRVDRYMKITQPTDDLCGLRIQGAQEQGLFDDALGAIAPQIFKRVQG